MSVLVSEDNEEMVATCDCGCKEGVHLKLMRWSDEPPELAIALVTDRFYAGQETFWTRFLEKIKRILCVIKNKEYQYCEILIEEKDFQKFKDFVNKL